MPRWWSRNSVVTTAQMVWLPRPPDPVQQGPVAVEPSDRLGAAQLELSTQDIPIAHARQYRLAD